MKMTLKFLDSKFTHDRMGILTVEMLSENQEVTPEGFLLCRNVPIARTGDQLYTADEIGLEANGDGLVKIQRLADEVFNPNTISSFEGKPVTIDHPDGVDVNPSNWKALTVGIVQNVRQGTGIEDDLLIADLLITDQQAIEAVRGKLREVSCGYDADYEQVSVGLGLQTNIVGNHVALVERGRAGARCSIRDKDIDIMKKPNKLSFMDKLRKFLDAETEAMEEEKKTDDAGYDEDEAKKTDDADGDEADEKDKKTTDADGELEARVAALESLMATLMEGKKTADADDDEKDEKDDDEAKKTDDDGDLTEAKTAETNKDANATTFGDNMRNVIARAEILVPGIKLPVGDALNASGAKANLMRKALTAALENDKTAEVIKSMLFGRDVGKLTLDSLQMAFNGASEMIKAQNNAKGVRNAISTKDFGKTTTPADINARNRELWAQK